MIKEALWDRMDRWDWMVIIGHRYSKSTFGADKTFSDTFSGHIYIMEGLPEQKQRD